MKRLMKRLFTQATAPRARVARVVVSVACAGLLTACDVHGVRPAGSLATIDVAPNPQTLVVNSTQQFVAFGSDFSGAKVIIAPTWSVVAGGGAISASGMFTAGATPGTFITVKATSGSISKTATVVVIAGPLASISIAPNPVTLAVGALQQVGSSRVDLQACKLEYSIVSPK